LNLVGTLSDVIQHINGMVDGLTTPELYS